MVIPAGVIAKKILIQNTALALLCQICNPYAPYAKVTGCQAGQQVIPQRFIQLFRKAACVRSDDGDIARTWVRIVQRDVLLHRQMEDIFLLVKCRARILANVLRGDCVFDDLEVSRGHISGQMRTTRTMRPLCTLSCGCYVAEHSKVLGGSIKGRELDISRIFIIIAEPDAEVTGNQWTSTSTARFPGAGILTAFYEGR
jgi:hypothetical protein